VSDTVEIKPSLSHLPVSIFASVMGFAGLALASRELERSYGFAGTLSLALTAVATVIWFVLVGFYLAKIFRFPEFVAAELKHPVRLSFFPTISIGLLLISNLVYELSELASLISFWVGVALQLGLTLFILGRWLNDEQFKTEHNSPAWFIPIIGNLVVPLAAVNHSLVEIGYFFYAIGMIFWLPLFAITLNRSFFFSATPEKLRPTFFILIAPPAVGFLGWFGLHEGRLDDFGVILYFFALFITLLLITQAFRFVRLSFGMPFWAYTFPLAALTIASFQFFGAIPGVHYQVIATVLYVVTFVVVFYVATLTVLSAIRGKICLPE
jgi:tellurite resistance protein